MTRCENCYKTPPAACFDCLALIDGGILRKKLTSPRKVIMQTLEGTTFIAELFMVSPVGLGMLVELNHSDHYTVNLLESLTAKVTLISSRGKNNYYGFDIKEVTRADGVSHRLNNEEYKILSMSRDELLDEIVNLLPQNIKSIIQERLESELEKAKLLDLLQVGHIFKYKDTILNELSHRENTLSLPINDLKKIINKGRKEGSYRREFVIDETERMYDVHVVPFNKTSGTALVIDITSIINEERELKKKEKRIYREILEAITNGKLLLVERDELSAFEESPKIIFEKTIKVPEEMDPVRKQIKEYLINLSMAPKELLLFLVCVSEALTNTLKHANGGTCKFMLTSTIIRIIISDNGPGIIFKEIPKATLMKNFSTKKSLGHGFTIMLQYTDRLILSTDPKGTTVILEKTIAQHI